MYEICGVDERPFTETTRAGTQIRAYFNSGLISVRREEGILGQWLADFLTLMDAKHFPEDGRRNMDQLALRRHRGAELGPDARSSRRPTTTCSAAARRCPSPTAVMPLEELVQVHYRKWLAVPGFVDQLEPPIPDGERLRWLKERLPLRPPGDS